MSDGPRPKILVLAEAANPDMVSVPLVGWSLTAALRDVADVHLVTQIRNRDAILRAGLVEGRDFTAINSERVARPLWQLTRLLGVGGASNKGWTISQAITVISDAYFERLVWKQFGARIKAGEWDVVHRITPLSPVKPSFAGCKTAAAGVPFVMGPLNGGVPWPEGFEAARNKEREWLSKVRGAVKLLPGRKATWRAAKAILVGSRHTQSEIADEYRDKTIYIPENGIVGSAFSPDNPAGPPHIPLRACFVGRLVPYKGPDMLIRAAAPLLRAGTLRLELIGNGPMLAELKALARAEQVEDAITFHGHLKHADVAQTMKGCDFLAFPSIREFGGGVVLEAMALGLPPLIVDYAGPGELVSPEWGFKVPVNAPDRLIADFRAQLEQIVRDPSILGPRGVAAQARVSDKFLWSRKAEQMLDVYDWVRGIRADKPQPF
ncbi:glycosyltransferase family 4 protein [Paracoccus sp. 11-3]|uniref:Glycosyltransferase family 4 protein n=1 Tax=Paracoccus amoyensis TaxID=2760093 RepID=A0A926GCL1_9RHOB|nr:glycosyltransferase family 4 protein [Paracoccus amoyensis]MBC9248523.1 glycosyltransferase family 4 protein [Paracoccus amoyensis]